ncbi:MAG: TerB family tellurite resistance protein [Thermoanaerobaculia bacterium]|nr:TerB family tellurite resistance protein [Thermoanaerobaculia bacterium]
MAIGKLMEFVRENLAEPTEEKEQRHEEAIRLATAVVLLDVAYADEEMSGKESSKIFDHLRAAFDLDEESVRELMEMADEIRRETIDHWHMTNQIRSSTSFQDRMEIVRTMWRIVYADGHFHQYEGYLVRKLSDLLGVEHRRMIDVKMEIREELGLE